MDAAGCHVTGPLALRHSLSTALPKNVCSYYNAAKISMSRGDKGKILQNITSYYKQAFFSQ